LKLAVDRGLLRTENGPRGAKHHFVTPDGMTEIKAIRGELDL